MSHRNNMKKKENKIFVTPQTLYHLHRMAKMHSFKTIGQVVDMLVVDAIKSSGHDRRGDLSDVHCKRKPNYRK